MDKTKLMEKVEYLWKKFDEYKERAEQHEFIGLFLLDRRLVPAYNDLHENYDEKHAEMFIIRMIEVLNSLGVRDLED